MGEAKKTRSEGAFDVQTFNHHFSRLMVSGSDYIQIHDTPVLHFVFFFRQHQKQHSRQSFYFESRPQFVPRIIYTTCNAVVTNHTS